MIHVPNISDCRVNNPHPQTGANAEATVRMLQIDRFVRPVVS
jgi:hypothetical protein